MGHQAKVRDLIELSQANLEKSWTHPNMCIQYLHEINDFLSQEWKTPRGQKAYLDDIYERFGVLEKIKRHRFPCPDGEDKCLEAGIFTPVVWAAFIAAPLGNLYEFLDIIRNHSAWATYDEMKAMFVGLERYLPFLFKDEPTIYHVARALWLLRYIWGHYKVLDLRRLESLAHFKRLFNVDCTPNGVSYAKGFQRPLHQRRTAYTPNMLDPPGLPYFRFKFHLFEDSRLRPGHPNPFIWKNNLAQDPRDVMVPFLADPYDHGRVYQPYASESLRDGDEFEIEQNGFILDEEICMIDYRFTLMAALLGRLNNKDHLMPEGGGREGKECRECSGHASATRLGFYEHLVRPNVEPEAMSVD